MSPRALQSVQRSSCGSCRIPCSLSRAVGVEGRRSEWIPRFALSSTAIPASGSNCLVRTKSDPGTSVELEGGVRLTYADAYIAKGIDAANWIEIALMIPPGCGVGSGHREDDR